MCPKNSDILRLGLRKYLVTVAQEYNLKRMCTCFSRANNKSQVAKGFVFIF